MPLLFEVKEVEATMRPPMVGSAATSAGALMTPEVEAKAKEKEKESGKLRKTRMAATTPREARRPSMSNTRSRSFARPIVNKV